MARLVHVRVASGARRCARAGPATLGGGGNRHRSRHRGRPDHLGRGGRGPLGARRPRCQEPRIRERSASRRPARAGGGVRGVARGAADGGRSLLAVAPLAARGGRLPNLPLGMDPGGRAPRRAAARRRRPAAAARRRPGPVIRDPRGPAGGARRGDPRGALRAGGAALERRRAGRCRRAALEARAIEPGGALPSRGGGRRASLHDLPVAPQPGAGSRERGSQLDARRLDGARRAPYRAAGGGTARPSARRPPGTVGAAGAGSARSRRGRGAARRLLAARADPGGGVAPHAAAPPLGAADELPPAADGDPRRVLRAAGAGVRLLELCAPLR